MHRWACWLHRKLDVQSCDALEAQIECLQRLCQLKSRISCECLWCPMHIVLCIHNTTLTEGENAVHFAQSLQSQLLEWLVFLDCMTD